MVSEARQDGDGTGLAELREKATGAVLEARRLLNVSGARPSAETLGPVIDQLAGVEAALARKNEDFSTVFVHLGLLLGTRCLNGRESAMSDSKERAEALRRLRWADHIGPSDNPLVVEARMMLIFLLAPWALPRIDGTRTALLDALLAAADQRVLTESLLRDLTEAKNVVDRIAEAPLGPEFQRQTARVKRDIEQMLASGSAHPDTTEEPAAATANAAAPEAATTGTAAPGHAQDTVAPDDTVAPENADAPESALLDAVRGLVALAGSRSTPQFTRILVWLANALHSRTGDHYNDVLELDPDVASLLRQAAAGGGAGADDVRGGADLALRAFRALPPDAPERARVARLHAYLLVTAELLEPGSVDFATAERPTPEPGGGSGNPFDDWPAGLTPEPGLVPHLDSHLRDFVTHLGVRERRFAAHFDRLLAYRTGDTGYLEDAATLLREAVDASPADSWWALALQVELAEVLEQAASHGGSFHDADVSLATMRGLAATLERDGSLPPDAPFALSLALSTADGELSHAQRTGNHEALPRLIDELRGRYAALPPDSSWRGELAKRLSRLEELRVDTQEATGRDLPGGAGAAGAARAGDHAAEREVTSERDVAAERELLERDLAEIRRKLDEPQVYHEQEYDRRARLGLRLLLAVVRGEDDPALLDEAIAELTRVRALLAEGRGRTQCVDVLTKLAEAHTMRAARGGPRAGDDMRAFVEITREALDELAADVLLQIGADHGLSSALNGALLSRRLAFVAFLTHRPADAVADLERGRALVLQAADASRSIPERLDAAGHPELARQWRAQVPPDPLRPETSHAPPPPADGQPIPSGLRRGALAALGVRPGAGEGPGTRQLVGIADVAELTAGLAATGTDALVYLIPGTPLPSRSFPGHALILRPGAHPAILPLPELLASDSPPLERYFFAAAERSRSLADPAMSASWRAAYEAEWQAALSAVCDWAWKAVMGPVLSAVRPVLAAQWPLARPPRIVLVPCGRLGAVPWHAARIRGLGQHGHRYACQEAVLSYAPSGTQFLAAATRRRMPPAAGRQVLVADPELTLPWAEVEAAALRAACYPDALCYGEFVTTGEVPDAAGTPAELLAVLPGGASPASLVHLSCHAIAAPRPTDSALWLAGPPGASQDAGRLTVAGILDGAAGRRTDTAGPLVVLSACETDLSTRHHDEALTLATALVTGGAADVVGSRWAVRDGPTAVMMAVFHHHLTTGALAPPDALRAAQLWMLSPHRELPVTLDGPLRREATRPDLHRLHHWAAFTHQGNPASALTG
ncbi:CHAT domain-containing protein [Streptomyces sp. NBC_01236]|uniref:CHAT domain-containing protein n=1 Tax=Streptomyces sp. NBC_01236 TaxID=2903789 RepID=UPI002E0EF1C1|nr:CHAT domain-containing protein [Streptomyces sp. NBC_01236]